jgi:hypothetical protein
MAAWPVPVVDGNENVDALHPVLRARVSLLCADPRVSSHLKVESAVRTYAEQKYLYDGYISGRPGFNLAANPDRIISAGYNVAQPRGSWHMQQSDRYGYAVDFNFSALPPPLQTQLESVAADYLLIRTVPSEQWHYQMIWGDWWTIPEDDMPLNDVDKNWISEEIKKRVGEVLNEKGGKLDVALQHLDREDWTREVKKTRPTTPTLRKLIKQHLARG